MNIQKIREAMNLLQERVPRGLIRSSIVSMADGQALMEFNSNPMEDALITQVCIYFDQTMKTSDFGKLGNYYLIDLDNHKTIVCLLLGDYWWGIVIDKASVPLGLLFNVFVPELRQKFNEASLS